MQVAAIHAARAGVHRSVSNKYSKCALANRARSLELKKTYVISSILLLKYAMKCNTYYIYDAAARTTT
jgi:hypothetical protein